jgi:thioredoxin-related protein
MYGHIINYLMYHFSIYTHTRKGDTNEDEVPILALFALYLATSLPHYFFFE